MPQEPNRQFLRRPVKVEFRVRNADDVMGGEILFDAVDISVGGAFLRSSYLLEIGERLEVNFTLSESGALIHTSARVVWVTPHEEAKGEAGMGLEFLDLSEAERKAITEYVRAQRSPQVSAQTPHESTP